MTAWIRTSTRAAIYARDTPEGARSPACTYCGRAVDIGRTPSDSKSGLRAASLDHIFPGAGNSRFNLVTACWECNSNKGERTPDEWEADAAAGWTVLPRWRSRRPEPTDDRGRPLNMEGRALLAVQRPTCRRAAGACRRELRDIDARRRAAAYEHRRRNRRR